MIDEQRRSKQNRQQLQLDDHHHYQPLQYHHQCQQENQTQSPQHEMDEDEMEDTDDLTGGRTLEKAVTNLSGEAK